MAVKMKQRRLKANVSPASGVTNATFPSLFGVIFRRAPLMFALMAVTGALVYFVGGSVPSRYSSQAKVLVEVQDNTYTRSTDEPVGVNSAAAVDAASIQSQVQLLQSYDLAVAVVDTLKLTERAEFDPLINNPDPSSGVLVSLGLSRNPARMTAQERAIESYLKKLTVYPIEKSRVITVSFESTDPQLPVLVLNALLDQYLRVQREAKQATTRDATAWLSSQIDDLRSSVATAEKRVADYRSQSGLLIGQNNATLNAQQLSELNSQLIIAQTQRSEAQVRAQSVRAMLASGQALDSSSDVLQSPLLGRLQERLISLRSQRSELLATLLSGHPRVKEIDAEIAGLGRQIRSEIQKISSALETEADLSGAREASLRANLEAIKAQVSSTTESEVRLRELEREAKAQRDLLELLLGRFREASARQDPNASAPDARVISRPIASHLPTAPQLGVLIIAAMAMVGLIVMGIIVMQYLLRYATSGAADVERPFAVPAQAEPVPPAAVAPMPAAQMPVEPAEPLLPEPVAIAEAPDSRDADSDSDDALEHEAEEDVSESSLSFSEPSLDMGGDQDDDELEEAEELAAAMVSPEINPAMSDRIAARIGGVSGPQIENTEEEQDAADFELGADQASVQVQEMAGRAEKVIATGDEMRAAITERIRSGLKNSIVVAPEAEGASRSVAIALARSLVKENLRVVVIDVNDTDISTRRPGAGLRALLSGGAQFTNVIQRDRASDVHVINADNDPDVSDLARSEQFLLMLNALGQTYDAVIMAGSPVTKSTETVALSAKADLAILIAVEDQPAEIRQESCNVLLAAGCPEVVTYVPEDNVDDFDEGRSSQSAA